MAHCFGTFVQLLGIMYIVIGWFQAVYIGWPEVYPNGWQDYPFRVGFEHVIGYFLAFSSGYNYIMAFTTNPHGSNPKKSMKINDKSYKKLIQLCEEERKRVTSIGYDLKVTEELIKDDITKFQDNHKFGLF